MKEKYKALFEKNWIWPLLAFAIPFMASVVICVAAGVYPFGEKCILHIDMYHQYCPFFTEFQRKLQEGGSLMYSWNIGLGTDFFATYIYYLASPLNWLLILCPKGFVIEFMTVTIVLKIALAGLFFFWFLKEHFSLVGEDGKYHTATVAPALVFSTAYAFSGFVTTYSWNIMWMDSVALAPLIILGLERLVKKNRPTLYYVTLALSIFCNYYISMIICIFLVLYFILLFLEQKEGKIKSIIRFAWYSLLAGGTGAVFLIPEAIILSYSSSQDSSWPEAMEWYFNIIAELSRLCVAADPYTGTNHWPNLYCGAFTVFLVVMYVMNGRIRWQEKVPKLVLLILFILGFANNYLDLIWHGLRFPRSLPGRQSFLFIFMMLVIGYETYRKRKGNKIWHGVLATLMCIAVLIASAKMTEEDITEPISFFLTGVFILAYALCFVIEKMNVKKMQGMICGFAFGLALSEIILNMGITGFYTLDRTSYLAKTDAYEALLKMADADAKADAEEGAQIFYRIEDIERKTKNDSALYGYPSGTIFSTIMDIEVSHFYQSVYMEGGSNYYCFNGATPILSSMLSAKYMISDNAEGENALREIISSYGGYYLYENEYCLPLGFMMSEEAVEGWDNSTGQKIYHINSLGYVLGTNENILNTADVEMEVTEGETTIMVPEDGIYYANYASCSADNLTISINHGAGTKYSKTTHRYLFELGECNAGDEITITNAKSENISFTVYKLNLKAVEEAYRTLSQQTMVTEKYSDTNVKGHIEVEEAGRLIFSIPYEEGWTLFVDGKEVEVESFKDTFISVHLEEGYHSIELRYSTPGLLDGVVISGVCVGLFLLTRFIGKQNWKKIIKKYAE